MSVCSGCTEFEDGIEVKQLWHSLLFFVHPFPFPTYYRGLNKGFVKFCEFNNWMGWIQISTLQLRVQIVISETLQYWKRGLGNTSSTPSCWTLHICEGNQQSVALLRLNLAASLCLPSVGVMFWNMPLL